MGSRENVVVIRVLKPQWLNTKSWSRNEHATWFACPPNSRMKWIAASESWAGNYKDSWSWAGNRR